MKVDMVNITLQMKEMHNKDEKDEITENYEDIK
jgi:hypothetical protein